MHSFYKKMVPEEDKHEIRGHDVMSFFEPFILALETGEGLRCHEKEFNPFLISVISDIYHTKI